VPRKRAKVSATRLNDSRSTLRGSNVTRPAAGMSRRSERRETAREAVVVMVMEGPHPHAATTAVAMGLARMW
jgi:hypothetical protein